MVERVAIRALAVLALAAAACVSGTKDRLVKDLLRGDIDQRRRAAQELSDLGAGFQIASHDLELRGAGDLLGARQSGQIAAVGFEMYTELLEETVAELQGLEKEERIDPEEYLRRLTGRNP